MIFCSYLPSRPCIFYTMHRYRINYFLTFTTLHFIHDEKFRHTLAYEIIVSKKSPEYSIFENKKVNLTDNFHTFRQELELLHQEVSSNNLFVTSKNETTNSPIHKFKKLHKGQRAFLNPFLMVFYFIFITLKNILSLAFSF